MVLLEQPRLTLPERQAKWAGIMATTRAMLWTPGDTAYVQVPMADQSRDTGLVVTTVGTEQVPFTYSNSLSVFDWATPPSYIGPLLCPVINFDGIGNWLSTADAPFWNDTAGSSEPSYCWAMWVFVVAGTSQQSLFFKTNVFSENGDDWGIALDSSERFQSKIIDASANGFIGSRTSALSEGLHHLVMTKADDNVSPGLASDVISYVDGVVDRNDFTFGSYDNQQDGTREVRIGAETDGGSPLSSPMVGAFAGPIFRAVGPNDVWTLDTVKRLYQFQGAALGIL